MAEQKQQAQAKQGKERKKENEALREAVRQLYVNDYPALAPDIRKAILKGRLKAGMSIWDVIAAYSLWAYATDPRVARYRDTGVFSEWMLVTRQMPAAAGQPEEWVLQRGKDFQYLHFENSALVRWKD